jgi:hypothetical protein
MSFLVLKKEEGGDAYLKCLTSFAPPSARQNVTRCLIDMTKSGIGLIQSRSIVLLTGVQSMVVSDYEKI